MIEKKIITTFYETDFNSLNSEEKDLLNRAKTSLESAYAPYSGFLVGATILLENGEIISGNNQENVAYPSGLCAERVAIFYAGSQFPDVKMKTIAITAISKKFEIKDVISPCGSCRQAIAEYEVKQEENIRILLHHPDNSVLILNSISDLLPFMFKSKGLKNY
ncbi:MAG: cytidine deaminase [Flavobacteriales bacterium]|jgi:cytidine deaminase|nr:cytidine deaminase [Flavobacteriales bacterium]MBT7481887.1 cytidine deaminase [Flavobacteriales bacterium]